MDLPGSDQLDSAPGAHRLLLSPFFLVEDLLAALLPGLVLVVLLFAKGEPSTRAAFATTIIGYKTRIACVVLIAYVIGKVIRMPLALLQSWLARSDAVQQAVRRFFPGAKSQSVLDKLDPDVKTVVLGALAGPLFLSKGSLIDLLMVISAQTGFSLSTGTVLLVASMIPGDGGLHWAELGAGCILFIAGVAGSIKLRDASLLLLGTAAARSIAAMSSTQLQTLVALLPASKDLVAVLAGTPASPKKPDAPEPPKTEGTSSKT